jgi:hypothetical protein
LDHVSQIETEIDMAGRVALIANEKGGVGKSVFTRTLIDWLRVK